MKPYLGSLESMYLRKFRFAAFFSASTWKTEMKSKLRRLIWESVWLKIEFTWLQLLILWNTSYVTIKLSPTAIYYTVHKKWFLKVTFDGRESNPFHCSQNQTDKPYWSVPFVAKFSVKVMQFRSFYRPSCHDRRSATHDHASTLMKWEIRNILPC